MALQSRAQCHPSDNHFFGHQENLLQLVHAQNERGLAGLYKRPGRGRKTTFNEHQKVLIQQWAQHYPRQLKKIVNKVKETWNITVSIHTIKRVLKSLQMSWHRFRRIMGGQSNPQEYAIKRTVLSR